MVGTIINGIRTIKYVIDGKAVIRRCKGRELHG